MEHPEFVIGVAIIAAAAMAYLSRLLRQPLVLAYIGAGVILGPVGLGLVTDAAPIRALSELGLVFLLFIVGLEFDLAHLKHAGRAGFVIGLVQVSLCWVVGFLLGRALGWAVIPSMYLASAAAFSSTAIAVKLLADRAELDTLAGRITVVVLVLQDLVAVLLLALQPTIEHPTLQLVANAIGRAVILVVATLILSRYVLGHVFRWVETTSEIILVSAIAWCFLVTGVGYYKLGLSPAIGALVAGASLSTFPYRLDVAGKLRSIRDFFVLLFFVTLGLQITAPTRDIVVDSLIVSAVVIVARFLTVVPTASLVGVGSRAGWVASFALAQVSEFALVLGFIGVGLGHIDERAVSTIAFSLAITTALSSYLVTYSHGIVTLLQRLSRRSLTSDDSTILSERPAKVIVLGCHRIGSGLIERLPAETLVVDFNPATVRSLKDRGVRAIVGDVANPVLLEGLRMAEAETILLTIPDDFLRGTTPPEVVARVRKLAPNAKVITTSDNLDRARAAYAAGADYVVLLRWLGAETFEQTLLWASAGQLEDARQRQQQRLTRADEIVP